MGSILFAYVSLPKQLARINARSIEWEVCFSHRMYVKNEHCFLIPQSICWNQISTVIVIRMRPLGGNWVMRVEPSCMGFVVLEDSERTRELSFCHVRTQEEGSSLYLKRALPRPWPHWRLTSDFQTPELWEIHCCFKATCLWHFVIAARTRYIILLSLFLSLNE